MPHRHELGEQVVRDGGGHHQVRHQGEPPVAEPVVQPVGRGDETVPLGTRPQPGSDHQIDDHDGQHETHRHHPREAHPVGLPG